MKRIALAIGLAASALCTTAVAQTWPVKPIKWIVPFAPGGTTDILARTIGEKLTTSLGQPVIVENKPGAGGGVGADFTAKAAPDISANSALNLFKPLPTIPRRRPQTVDRLTKIRPAESHFIDVSVA